MQIKHILSLCYKWANFNFALKIAKSHWKIFIMPSRKLLYISLEIVIYCPLKIVVSILHVIIMHIYDVVFEIKFTYIRKQFLENKNARTASAIQRNLISLFDIYVVLLKAPIDIFQNISYWLVRCEKCW